MKNFINDGYDQAGYIEPRHDPDNGVDERGLFSPMRFRFRPAINDERVRHIKASQSVKSPLQQEKKIREFIADKLIEWDLTMAGPDDEEAPVPITPENLGRIRPALLTRLYLVILGTDACDIDPAWSEEQSQEYVGANARAEDEQVPIGPLKENEDLKNSEAASH